MIQGEPRGPNFLDHETEEQSVLALRDNWYALQSRQKTGKSIFLPIWALFMCNGLKSGFRAFFRIWCISLDFTCFYRDFTMSAHEQSRRVKNRDFKYLWNPSFCAKSIKMRLKSQYFDMTAFIRIWRKNPDFRGSEILIFLAESHFFRIWRKNRDFRCIWNPDFLPLMTAHGRSWWNPWKNTWNPKKCAKS